MEYICWLCDANVPCLICMAAIHSQYVWKWLKIAAIEMPNQINLIARAFFIRYDDKLELDCSLSECALSISVWLDLVISLSLSLSPALVLLLLLCLCRNEFIMTTKTRLKNKLQASLVSVQQLCHYFLKHKNLSQIYTNCTRFVFVRIKEIAMTFMFFLLFLCSPFFPQRLHLLSVCLSVCMYVRFSAFPFCAAFSRRFINI